MLLILSVDSSYLWFLSKNSTGPVAVCYGIMYNIVKSSLVFLILINRYYLDKKRMAQVIDGHTMSVGEMLGGAAQDSNGAQLKFKQINDTSPPFFEARGTDNRIYSFEMTSMFVRLTIRSASTS
jgi:hypothetical protein